MARRISWLARLHDIRRAVVNASSSHFDRGDMEKLFQVQPRAAGKLMGLLPRSDALGNSHLVARIDLVALLERLVKVDDVPAELERIRREGPRVNRRRKIAAYRRDDGLIAPKAPERPDAVTLTRGEMYVRWNTIEEWMETVLHQVLKVHDDEAAFIRDFCNEKTKPADRDIDELRELIRRTEVEFDAWMAARRGGSSGGMSAVTPTGLDVAQCNPAS